MPPGRSSPRTSLSASSRDARAALDDGDLEPVATGRIGGRERAACPREATEQNAERVGHGVEERLGQAARRHHAERVPEQPCVLDRDQTILSRDPNPQRSTLGLERRRVRRVELVVAEIAATPEEVVQLVGRARVAGELCLDLGEGRRVEQVAQLLLAEELAKQVAVERQRLRPPFGRGRVVLVHVRRDVGEEQRRGERRRGGGLDLDEIELARLEPAQDPLQRREVEDVLQALAIRLEDDRKGAVVARHLEQALRLEALLPERRPLARTATRNEQRPPCVLTEPGAEQGRLPDLLHDEILDLLGREEQIRDRWGKIGLREMEGDPVVRPDRLHLEAERVSQARAERHGPRRVHPGAERGQDAQSPVADLVPEPLDDDGPVGRDDATVRRGLVSEVGEQVLRGERVEVVVGAEARERLRVAQRDDLA